VGLREKISRFLLDRPAIAGGVAGLVLASVTLTDLFHDILVHGWEYAKEPTEIFVYFGFPVSTGLLVTKLLRLRKLSLIDSLTEVFNCKTFYQALELEISRAKRHLRPVSLLVIDLDNFKGVNDQHGHLAGDGVLKQVAQAIKGCLRQEDWVCRYGGDEFAVILPGVGEEEGEGIAQRIKDYLEQRSLFGVTVSIGVATTRTDLTERILVHKADQAMYEAKRLGKNRVCVAT